MGFGVFLNLAYRFKAFIEILVLLYKVGTRWHPFEAQKLTVLVSHFVRIEIYYNKSDCLSGNKSVVAGR